MVTSELTSTEPWLKFAEETSTTSILSGAGPPAQADSFAPRDWFEASGAGGTGVAGVVGYGVKRLGMGSQTRKALIRGLPGLAVGPRIPR